jgi:hypothetical protein
MIVLQENQEELPTQHLAFTVDQADMERAANELREQDHEWMPATSVYFTAPNGHALELCAPADYT